MGEAVDDVETSAALAVEGGVTEVGSAAGGLVVVDLDLDRAPLREAGAAGEAAAPACRTALVASSDRMRTAGS